MFLFILFLGVPSVDFSKGLCSPGEHHVPVEVARLAFPFLKIR